MAIHAAKAWNGEGQSFASSSACWNPLRDALGFEDKWGYSDRIKAVRQALPFGAVIAVCNLVDCLPTDSTFCLPGVFDDHQELDTPQERAFGNYAPGRFGLVTANMRRLREPIPFKSRQGKLLGWEPPANLEELFL
jgi:hypothetical protein